MSYISTNVNLLQNSLLAENLFVNPVAATDISTYNNFASGTLVTDVEDYAEISPRAYEMAIIEDIKIPKSPTAAYENNYGNLILDYLNKDIDYNIL